MWVQVTWRSLALLLLLDDLDRCLVVLPHLEVHFSSENAAPKLKCWEGLGEETMSETDGFSLGRRSAYRGLLFANPGKWEEGVIAEEHQDTFTGGIGIQPIAGEVRINVQS